MKKILALAAVLSLWLTVSPPSWGATATALSTQFADTGQPAWGAPVMQRMIQTGIVQGYQGTGANSSTYYAYPNHPVTRAEFAVLLARSLNLPDSSATPPLADWSSVPSWAQPKVATLFSQQVVQGQPGPGGQMYFAAADYITRAELVAMLERALSENGGNPSGTSGSTSANTPNGSSSPGTAPPASGNGAAASAAGANSGSSPFADVTPGDWYYDYVLAAYHAGIVQGLAPNYFGPSGDATRVQVMAMLWRSLTADQTDLPADSDLVSPVQTVNNLAVDVLQGQDKSQLAPYLTGEAALELSTGNFFVLESTSLNNLSQVQISYPAGAPRVVARSRYLATVETTVNLNLSFSGGATGSGNYQAVEYYHLIRDGGQWLVYAVDTYSVSIDGGPPAMTGQTVDAGGGF